MNFKLKAYGSKFRKFTTAEIGANISKEEIGIMNWDIPCLFW